MRGQVTWDRGVALPDHGLWLDPQVVRDLAVVSHAHSDHARRHTRAILTEETLLLATGSRRPRSAQVVSFGVPARVGAATVTLHPAGHMLGSAQAVIEHGGSRLLYTGDIKLRRPGGSPATPVPAADVLVVESTYGLPGFRFPDPDAIVERIAIWCRRTLDAGATPVLLAHALGKAQEVMLALAPYGFEFALETRCVEYARSYEDAGVKLPAWVELGEEPPRGRVVICPPVGKDEIRRLNRYRTALISGWAQDPSFWRRFGADVAFPLSDHCDFDELVEVARTCGAQDVYTVHGFVDELARHLRKREFRASPLGRSEQLLLAL